MATVAPSAAEPEGGRTTLGKVWLLLRLTAEGFIADDAWSRAASIAYFTLFSMAPTLLVVIAVAGLTFGQEAARGAIVSQLGGLMGRETAEAMQAKAEAFARYGDAAILDLLVRMLPQVVEAASAPMRGIDKMTVISTDGASSLTKSVASNVAQGLQLGTDLTGIDLTQLLSRLSGMANGDGPDVKAVTEPAATAPRVAAAATTWTRR